MSVRRVLLGLITAFAVFCTRVGFLINYLSYLRPTYCGQRHYVAVLFVRPETLLTTL